jgi:DNA repair exonuclease SbcCD ATPase subunit
MSRSNHSNKKKSFFQKLKNRSNKQPQINPGAPKKSTFTQRDDIVDYLSEDDEINSQRYGCISFATITDEMKEEFQQQIADQLRKPIEDVRAIVSEWCSRENPKRAVKVRGTFKTLEQSYSRAEEIRNYDANFHIFTCEVGKWLPFDPNPALLEDENYMEQNLNELLQGYKLNKQKTKMHYDQRKRDMVERAILEGTPEGQQLLAQSQKPIEAIKYEAEQAEESIEQLHDRIKEMERKREIALRALKERHEELENFERQREEREDLEPEDDNRIIADVHVENLDEKGVEALEQDGIRRGIDKMREIQNQSKRLETNEFAQELSKRKAPLPGQKIERDEKTHGMFEDDLMIPSKIRGEKSVDDSTK